MRKVALVTGSAGFVGRHMVAELERRNWVVDAVDIADDSPIDALEIFTGHVGSFTYDLVVHLAAVEPHRAAIDNNPGMFPQNAMLDSAMFAWAIRTRQKQVLYFSSCAVLDGPDDYGWTKLTGERMAEAARRAGVKTTVVRPYSGYGEDQSENFPFGAFVARAKRGETPFPVWNPNAVRDWIHVDDVVIGALAVAETDTTEPVSLCTGIGTSCGRLATLIAQAAGYDPILEWITDKPLGVPYRVGDPTAMRRVFIPQISLEEGIKRALGG